MTHFQKKNDSDIIACGYSKVEAYAEDIPYLIDEINELRFQKEKTEMRKVNTSPEIEHLGRTN